MDVAMGKPELSGEENQAPKLKKQALIIRRKSFDLEPMNENEAIAQMKMLGHEKFYVFLNNQTQSINIAYRRRNGTYGIIEPRM
jgi:putative sigma-54 modulation protein